MQESYEFGNRERKTDDARIRCLVALLVFVFAMNGTLGFNLELDRLEQLERSADNWAIADFKNGITDEFLAPKTAGTTRVLYLSNSHAFTGGLITEHLQGFLDDLAPGRFEVINLAEPGIFAPDMLQRGLRSLDYDIDLVLVGLNYINFSDRMRLDMQAHSARSFFNRNIFTRLPPGFWLRNYDLGLYSSVLTERVSHLYRNRNTLRNLWEAPLANGLKSATGDARPVFFLEMEADERWRFPDGYDNNLFQWNLYASGREGHLRDMEGLLAEYTAQDIPVIAVNMPIDFGKSVYEPDLSDLDLFSSQLQELADRTLDFEDYQGSFPAGFSTYDALHPTWHGARLHAFSLLLKLESNSFLDDITDEQLLETFLASDEAISQQYLAALDGNYPPHPSPFSFTRYDPSEPDNARDLLRHLAAHEPGSPFHSFMLDRMARVIRFWTETDFPIQSGDSVWAQAVNHEIDLARERMAFFSSALEDMELQRLTGLDIPDITGLESATEEQVTIGTQAVTRAIHRLENGDIVVTFATPQGRIFSRGYQRTDGTAYFRTDILGNDTFIQLSPPSNFTVPAWVGSPVPDSRWGI